MIWENVLLIDDSDIDNLVNKKVIEKTGLAQNIVVKKSAQSAVDYLDMINKENPRLIPDIIFLDIRMPDIDGFGFLEIFKNLHDSLTQRPKIIMLSSSIDSDDFSRAMNYSYVKRFINKPLSREILQEIAII